MAAPRRTTQQVKADIVTSDADVMRSATYGLTFTLERFGVAYMMTAPQLTEAAANTLRHSMGGGRMLHLSEVKVREAELTLTSDQRLARACAAENARDRALVQVQAALHALGAEHPELSTRLAQAAAECGVIWAPSTREANE